MNEMNLFGSSGGARRRAQRYAHRFSHNAGLTSIRFATVLGCLCAFVLLCMLSLRANAAPLVDGTPRTLHVDDSRLAAAPAARDVVGQAGHPARDGHSSDEAVASARFVLPPADSRHFVGQPKAGEHEAAIERQTWLLALAAPAVVALAGACLSRAALKRAAEKQHYAEGEWKRRCDAADAREQVARVAASAEASAAAKQDRLWLLGTMRLYAEAPLIAVSSLLESLETALTPSARRAQMPVIRFAVRTWSQTLHDLLDISPLESRAVVLDESVTNLRELVDGVIVLLSPSAAQRGLRLSAGIDQAVAERILVDSARLGQIFFHLLSRTVQLSTRGEIALVVSAEPLNSGSQRILINVTDVGAEAAPATQLQLFAPDADQPLADGWFGDTDACLPLCQILAQRMQGELSVASGSGPGTRASFSAPFTVEQWRPAAEPASNVQAPVFANAAQSESIASALSEPFERRYLDALSEEGIDIPMFLGGWRHSMDDDLKRLSEVSHDGDYDGQSALLHRLSGAVGLVGAHSLMEALQFASGTSQEREAGAIDTLAERARTLMAQLDTEIATYRSTTR
ncbi:HAMP domain-containing sensor histidine kinase [Paraburkholderia fungorum]|uniref:sensor histidine kinase n=1 Tax=Paraburkholderia fungorum TaxID=134537 RepID=UPI0038BDACE8